jgi:hypothetical protein
LFSHGFTMKTILIPTEDHDMMPAVLEAARLIARAFDSYMEGFAVRPSIGRTYVTAEHLNSLPFLGAYEGDIAPKARGQFESFMQAHGVPRAEREPAVFSYGWPLAEAMDDAFIGSYEWGQSDCVDGQAWNAHERRGHSRPRDGARLRPAG